MLTITLVNGFKRSYNHYITVLNLAKDIKYSFKKTCIGAFLNGILVDVNTIIKNDSFVVILTINDIEALNFINNSLIQMLGYAVKICFPKAQLVNHGIINNGFYYDVDFLVPINKNDIKVLENCMHNLIKKKYLISKVLVSNDILNNVLINSRDFYKICFFNKIKNIKKYIIYFHEEHFDLNLFPQVKNSSICKYFILNKISGVYWNGNSSNKMIQRIYGSGFLNKKTLDFYFKNLKELKKRDHRKIGKDLNLFHIQEDSPGMIFWNSNGLIIYKELENFIREKLKEYLYLEVKTPIIMNRCIWKKSGHWDNYKDSLFSIKLDEKYYCVKPMNCPGHIELFKIGLKSYRDLPIRIAEFGICHRNESSGALHGLMRVRNFTQDDAHIFCTKNQIKKEINNCIKMIYDIYDVFGFINIKVNFSTRPKERIGSNIIWDIAEKSLEDVLNENNLDFIHKIGEGAFYGPKIEFILQDSLNRQWQCGTIQLDFYLSSRFNIFYINKKNKKKHPIIIHRAILGSMERFIGILTEEYLGNFPIWLSPIQVIIISVNCKHNFYVKKIFKKFLITNIRIKMNLKLESVSLKIREAILQKIPYIIICGDKEVLNSSISVRNRLGKKSNFLNVDNFIKQLQYLIKIRSLNLLEE